jgi:uncharacterized repeat protein (TIGR01451 family)
LFAVSRDRSRLGWLAVAVFCVLACWVPVTAAPAATTSEEECVGQCADLIVSEDATNEVVGIGERFSYYVTVENDGPADAAAVTLIDTLPVGVTFVSAESEDLECTHSGRHVTCTTPMLPLDGAAEVALRVEAPNEVGTIVNEAVVTSSVTGELDSSSNTTSLETGVGTDADLLIYTVADEAAPGDPIHFFLSIVNDGPQSTHAVSLRNTLPAGVTLQSATPTQGACAPPSGRELKCALGTLPPFEMVEVELVVSGAAEGIFRNLASVEAEAPFDPDLENNHDVATAVIGTPAVADLAVYQDPANEPAGAGSRFTYLLSVDNDGPAKAIGVSLTDELPDGVTYVAADGLPCVEAAGVVTCAVGELAAGASAEVALEVEVPNEVGTLVNEVAVTSGTADFDASNNTNTLETQVGTGANLDLTASGSHPGEGAPVEFLVTVWNEGLQSAEGVVVEDLLPAGVTLVSATPTAGSCEPPSARRFTCSLGELAPLDDVEIEIVVSGATSGLHTNFASVTSAGAADPEPGNNQDSHIAVVGDPPLADVSVYKTAPALASLGEDLVYAVTAENVGPEIALGVRVTDRLPTSVAFVAATVEGGTPCAHASGTVTCDLGDLVVDVPVEITITVRPQSVGLVANTVEVAAQGGPADPAPESNASTAETAVGVPPTANGDAYELDEDEVLSVTAPGLLVNDTDPDSTALHAKLVSGTVYGWLTLRHDGSFRYLPHPNFSGSDSFAYLAGDDGRTSERTVVTITVAAVNDPPMAANDAYRLDEDGRMAVSPAEGVLDNDTDVEGATLTATLVSAPADGTLAFSADGSFSYVPRPNFHGADSFTYKANDGELDSSPATVNVTVTAINDPPIAANDAYRVDEDGTLAISSAEGVLENDTDVEGSALTAKLVSAPANGTLALSADGSFTYVPRPDFHGGDSFTYKANDGGLDSSPAKVDITVAEGPSPPQPPPVTPRYQLTVAKIGTGLGTVGGAPGIACGTDCLEEYDAGSVVTLVATAARGSRFVAWAAACGGAAAACTLTMNTAKAVTATFAKIVAKPKPRKVAICFRKRTFKVPKSQVAKYKKRGAKLGPCRKPRKKG